MAYIHEHGVLHCGVNCNNILLGKDLAVKYVDFQGRQYASDRRLLLFGLSEENPKSWMPRDGEFPDCETDIFVLSQMTAFEIAI